MNKKDVLKCEHSYIVISWKLKKDALKNAQSFMCQKCCDIIDFDDLLRIFAYKNKVKCSQSGNDLVLDGSVLVGSSEVFSPDNSEISK